MREKVYCIFNIYDNIIMEGVADFKERHCHFSRIFSDDLDDWTDDYHITLLDEKTFELELISWEYWQFWIKQTKIPHPMKYAEMRITQTLDEILPPKIFRNTKNWRRAELNYQNQLIIDKFLNNHPPTEKSKAKFMKGKNAEAFVEWSEISSR